MEIQNEDTLGVHGLGCIGDSEGPHLSKDHAVQVLTNEKDKLYEALKERLSTARQVDIATAWATEGRAIRLLESCRPDALRVIVGLHGNVTTPGALRRLQQIANLRLAPDEPMFHAKVFIFRDGDGGETGWMGSANLTHRGFGQNEEAVLEIADAEALSQWFEGQWDKCGAPDPSAIDRYCSNYKRPPGPFAQSPPQPPEIPSHLNRKHTRISCALLDSPNLDDLDAWEVVRKPSGKRYRENKWEDWKEDIRWNRRFIYTAIRVLEHQAKYGRPPNAKAVIADWCSQQGKKWLAGVVSISIGEKLIAKNNYLGEPIDWANVYVRKLRELDPSERQRIRSAMVRKTVPSTFLGETVDAPLLQLWPMISDE